MPGIAVFHLTGLDQPATMQPFLAGKEQKRPRWQAWQADLGLGVRADANHLAHHLERRGQASAGNNQAKARSV